MSLLSRPARARGPRCWVIVLLLLAALPFASVRTGATTTFTATTVGALIADINTANTSPGQYTINLTPGGVYTLIAEATTGSGTGLPTITSGVDLTIVGNGATIQRDATTTNLRLFSINGGGTLRLTGLTLRNGHVTGAAGANGGNGTGNMGGAGGAARGGAIYNNGTLTVASSTFTQNSVSGGAGGTGGSGASGGTIGGTGGTGGAGGDAAGGALFNSGTMSITNSTLVGNTTAGGIGGNGGSAGIGTSGNGADGNGNNGGSGQGGAIASLASGSQPVTNTTITMGSAVGGIGGTGRNGTAATGVGAGGGMFNNSGALLVTNTILSGNTAPTGGNCAGNSISDGGANIEYNPATTCGFTNPQTGDPLLGALVNHGGPTQTMALGASSAAAGHGNATTCAGAAGGVDQRGLPRPTPCSIGAFEPQPQPFPTLAVLSSSSGSTTGGSSVTLAGTGFVAHATVQFGTASGTITAASGSTVTVTVPGHAAGVVDITLTNPDMQAATLPLAYTFGAVTALPPPQPTAPPTPSPRPLPGVPRPTGTPVGNGPPLRLPPPR